MATRYMEPEGRDTLSQRERVYFRDRFRQARYAALADAEGFHAICYALEELGCTLRTQQRDLGKYQNYLAKFVAENVRDVRSAKSWNCFSPFDPLYTIVRYARNDAMHTGAYARHVTEKATELCLLLEDALMATTDSTKLVRDYMVREPVAVDSWQPVARARQLMLTHSFSNLPVQIGDNWFLITEMGMAKYIMRNSATRGEALGRAIQEAAPSLGLVDAMAAMTTTLDADVQGLVDGRSDQGDGVALWLVLDEDKHLVGVISAFELM